MRRARLGPAAVLLAAGIAGCTQSVAGTAAPAGMQVPAAPVMVSTPARSVADAGLLTDVVTDECLLNASEAGLLVGHAVRPPEQSTVARTDGSTSSSCVVVAGADPVATINVYRAVSGRAAAYVTASAHPLTGVGDAAAVLTTDAGPMLQLAAGGYLVTILVAQGTPGDDAWRAAATAAVSRLPH